MLDRACYSLKVRLEGRERYQCSASKLSVFGIDLIVPFHANNVSRYAFLFVLRNPSTSI